MINDVEPFGLQNDPHELDNLALDRVKNADLLMAMNAKLNRGIDEEAGEDVGQMLHAAWMTAGWRPPPSMTFDFGNTWRAPPTPGP